MMEKRVLIAALEKPAAGLAATVDVECERLRRASIYRLVLCADRLPSADI